MSLLGSIIDAGHSALASGPGLLAQFNGPGFSSGPPAFIMFFIVVIFVVVIGGIIFKAGKGVMEWSDNNQQPVLTVLVKVVAKRNEVSVSSYNNNSNSNFRTRSSTSYFATFEFASGDRKEFEISDSEYGMLVEGDGGELTFQGTRYKGFQRKHVTGKDTEALPAVSTERTSDEAVPQNSEHSFCPYCGVQVDGDFKYCPHCGKTQPVYESQS